MKISNFLKADDVVVDLVAPSKANLILKISTHASTRLGVAAPVVQSALLKREQLGSTGIGAGVAIPHAPVGRLQDPFVALFVLKKAVDFESVDDVPVDIVFLVLSALNNPRDHLKILSALARATRDAAVRSRLKSAQSATAAYALLLEAEGDQIA